MKDFLHMYAHIHWHVLCMTRRPTIHIYLSDDTIFSLYIISRLHYIMSMYKVTIAALCFQLYLSSVPYHYVGFLLGVSAYKRCCCCHLVREPNEDDSLKSPPGVRHPYRVDSLPRQQGKQCPADKSSWC